MERERHHTGSPLDAACDRLDRALRLGLQGPLRLYLMLHEVVLDPLWSLAMSALISITNGALGVGPAEPACRFQLEQGPGGRRVVRDRTTGNRWWLCTNWLVSPHDWRGLDLERDLGPGWRLPTRDEVLAIVRRDAGGGPCGDFDGAFDSERGRAVWVSDPSRGTCSVEELRDSTREDSWGRTQGGPDRSETFVLAVLPSGSVAWPGASTAGPEPAPVPPEPAPGRFVQAGDAWLVDCERDLEWLVLSADGIKAHAVASALSGARGGWRLPNISELTELFASRPVHRELWNKLERSCLWSVPSDVVTFRLVMDRRDRLAYRVSGETRACLVVVRRADMEPGK